MARVRSVSTYQSHPLDEGWELAEVPAGAAARPVDLEQKELRWVHAARRGTVASILRAAGQWELGDSRNLDDVDWWYRCRFPAAQRPADARTYLRLDGLATVAEVWLNGVHLLRSENMYLAHALEVTELLHLPPGPDNVLYIRFHSLSQLLQGRRPRPRWRTRLTPQQQLRFFRTTLLGRMPGWCPPVAPIGPFRPVVLEQRRGAAALSVKLAVDARSRRVAASLRIAPLVDGLARGAELIVAGRRAPLQLEASGDDTLLLTGEVHLPDAAPWWPHTHGAQPLYEVGAQLGAGDLAMTLDCGRIGFRELAIETGAGDDFSLCINGAPVFCRGACWTPLDVVGLSPEPAGYREALSAAREAGMNMLRLPGSLLYETPLFHELCDELGVLVWQDFMFANLDYPSGEEPFLATVRAEAQQLLTDLQQSPSLAVLCGGSEVEQQAAMMGLPRQQWSSPLFQELLPAACQSLRPDVPYWPASPSGGELPFQVNAGVAHYYGVGAYLRPLDDARRCEVRFAAECLAFANVPEESTLESCFAGAAAVVHHPLWKSRVPRDVGAGWDFEDVRDHYLRLLFEVDPMRLRYSDCARYLLLSRVVTGEVMASAFAEWRRRRASCHGALVWLLRDLWPGAGWGVIDALGTPKASYYYLKRALRPLALFLTDEGLSGLYAHVVNESAQAHALTLHVALYRHGEVRIAEGATELSLPARAAVEIPLSRLFSGFLDTSYAYRFGPPSHEVVVARLVESHTGQVRDTAFFFPLGFGALGQAELGLAATAQAQPDGSRKLCIRTQKFAQSVVICASGFLPDDNYFHLEPGGERCVTLRPRTSVRKWQATITAVNATAAPLWVREIE